MKHPGRGQGYAEKKIKSIDFMRQKKKKKYEL